MSTVSCTESVVYIAIGVRSQFFGKSFLAFLDYFFSSCFFFVAGVFGQITGFTLFLGVKTQVLQQQGFAGLQSSYLSVGLLTIFGKVYGCTQTIGNVLLNSL